MIPENQLLELTRQLLSRSEKDEVRWGYDPNPPNFNATARSFRVNVGNASVSIHFVCPTARSDFYFLSILNDSGEQVAAIRANVDDTTEAKQNWLALLHDLFSEAERHVTGWDKVFAELEKAIRSPDPVGSVPIGDEVAF